MPFSVAIIGSGPAGFYVAEALLQSGMSIQVDMIERLPVPFGLVRYGVAPDHQKLKAVTAVFENIANDKNFTFLGNVEVGRDVQIAQLLEAYDAVVVATGALTGRPLGVPGENLPGSISATEFVAWYNGHPDFQDREFDLSHPNAVIIGNGNVALDVCRILAKDVSELKNSDISSKALEALAASKITDIYLVGRRGPVQAKFTTRELREFGSLGYAEPVVDAAELELNAASLEELQDTQTTETAAKNIDVLRRFSKPDNVVPAKSRRVHFCFLLSPLEVVGNEKVEAVKFEKVELSGAAFHQVVKSTGEEVSVPAGLVVRSVGYRGTPITDIPFSFKSATIPHAGGRVLGDDGTVLPGLYTAGWIKRGPSGIIGTNRACGVETASAILTDFQSQGRQGQPGKSAKRDQLLHAVRAGSRPVMDFEDWREIDALERAVGEACGKPREKLTSIAAMLDALKEDAVL